MSSRVFRMRKVSLAAAAILAATATAPALAGAPPSTPLEQVQALVQPSVVYETITWTGYVYDRHNDGYFTDQPFTVSYQCTGFVVNPDGYIGTAGHCVDYDQTVQNDILSQVVDWAYENDYYQARPNKATIATFARHWRIDGTSRRGRPDQAVGIAYGVSVSGEPSGKALPARVVAVRSMDQGDVALLKVDARNLTVVPLSDNSNTGVGTQIVSVGYPASVDLVTDSNFNPSFKEGTISAEKTVEGGLLPVYEISAPVSGGMSGGPTTGLDGQVIGVNSFKITGETQPFNFVQPAQNLQELLAAEGVQNTMGNVTDQYRSGLDAYFAGNKDAAVSDFQAVLAVVPSHEFAQQYLQKAQALPDSGGIPTWVWVALVLVLLALAVLVIAILATRRRTRSAAGVTAQPSMAMSPPEPAVAPQPPAQPATEASAPAPAAASAAAPTPPPAAAPPPAATPAPSPEPPAGDGPDLFCPHCGKHHDPDAEFCPHCGRPLA